MTMTEEQAKTKWCPYARVIPAYLDGESMSPLPIEVPAHNRIQEIGAPRGQDATTHKAMNCIASECMAWRGQWRRKSDGLLCGQSYPSCGDGERVGHCGLAGAP